MVDFAFVYYIFGNMVEKNVWKLKDFPLQFGSLLFFSLLNLIKIVLDKIFYAFKLDIIVFYLSGRIIFFVSLFKKA